MGATPEQSGFAHDDEKPAHSVTLSDYFIGETEVTFIAKLNLLTGKTFRLPTEAEWEYVARGGSKSRGYRYSGSDSADAVAWYDGNSSNQAHPVKTKQPNELGLYGMSGNVWEWCSVWFLSRNL